jgi:hypothetical protein
LNCLEKDEVEKLEMKAAAILMLALLLASMLSMVLVIPVKAQYAVDSHTVALWHFDEIDANDVTPDATGTNPAILGGTPPPILVEGKFGKAFSFDGNNLACALVSPLLALPSPYPIYVPISPSLDISAEITIEAWINVKAFKNNNNYNNIVVECARTVFNNTAYNDILVQSQNITRIWGLAVKTGLSENGNLVPKGALGGFVFTDTGGFNEIVTTEPVISLNQWINVTFTRSLTTGMHIYVNGAEKSVKAIYGVQNPTGAIRNGTELYMGHDGIMDIDELRILNPALQQQIAAAEIDIGPNLLAAVVIVAVVLALAWLLRRVIQTWAVRSRSKN